jgi:hypothetical protein
MNEAANQGGAAHQTDRESVRLLQRVSDAIKRPFYSGAGGLHGDDDRNGNSSCDETILDGGRPRIVFQETQNKLIHLKISGVTAQVFDMHAKILYSANLSSDLNHYGNSC